MLKKRAARAICLWIALGLAVLIGTRGCAELVREPGLVAARSVSEAADLSSLSEKVNAGEALTDSERETILEQTGLGEAGLDEAVAQRSGNYLLSCQAAWQSTPQVECVDNGLTSSEELLTDSLQPKPIDLRAGDILVSLNSHTVGYRHGHAALVLDESGTQVLEAFTLGTDSTVLSASHWRKYPAYVQLRLKDEYGGSEVGARVAEIAGEQLVGLPYDLFSGFFLPSLPLTKAHESAQCASIIWAAYALAGVDIRGGGIMSSPTDLLNSPALEIVQSFGGSYLES